MKVYWYVIDSYLHLFRGHETYLERDLEPLGN